MSILLGSVGDFAVALLFLAVVSGCSRIALRLLSDCIRLSIHLGMGLSVSTRLALFIVLWTVPVRVFGVRLFYSLLDFRGRCGLSWDGVGHVGRNYGPPRCVSSPFLAGSAHRQLGGV